MLRLLTRALGIAGATALMTFAGSGVPTAAASAEDYGQHVRTCVQTMGFDGTHNPGMHMGFAGWDPTHVC